MSQSMDESNTAVIAVEETESEGRSEGSTQTRGRSKSKLQPNYHVIIWNDEVHTFKYVIELLMRLFKHSFESASNIAAEIDSAGKGIAMTCHQELAELKRDQVLGYGADPESKDSRGPVWATIEPAPE